MLRPALPLVAPISHREPEARRISPRELRTFLGEPKQRQWVALLARAGVKLKWETGRRRVGLTKAQVLRVMRARYSEIGELRLRRWNLR